MLHMEHNSYKKDYVLEIISELIRGKNHVRALSKRLDVNHMIIVRKLRELVGENVVDYTWQGRNKTYFLKNNVETKSYVFKMEHYRIVHLLKRYPFLRSVVEKIQGDERLRLVVLFGSYAKGIAGKTSDIDVYIETKDRNIKKELELVNSKLNVKIGGFDKSSLLAKEIIKNHVILKGVEEFYGRTRFFE